ncbi:GGDEF domain-containing phosphodiesterase [Stakelama pacifica]|nr:GGDEF domain-containing phosphodiesterase [Stakelama pacifica]
MDAVPGRPVRKDGAGRVSRLGHSRDERAGMGFWRILILAEISNFASLRRHLGQGRAAGLARAVKAAIRECFSFADVEVAGRNLIEIRFDCSTAHEAEEVVQSLEDHFRAPFALDEERYLLSLSIGGGLCPAFEGDDIRLVEAAETALDQAREENRAVLLDLSREELQSHRPALVRELPRAIAAGELFMQYQPKVHVRRQEIASAEALVRWDHPTRGLILPGEFISAAEAAGSICALTLWCIKQVIHDQRIFAERGYDIPVFVNISGVLLADSEFVAQVCALLEGSSAKIGFEITETAVIRDPAIALKHLQQFADIGVPVAIDDYGAGLSSLAYLKQLPASELKIDKMFITQLTSSNRDPLIVRSTIDLAHAMEMEVTAEGVETPAALALLSVMGCDLVQGYLISRPLGRDAFLAYVEEEAHRKIAPVGLPNLRNGGDFWKRALA